MSNSKYIIRKCYLWDNHVPMRINEVLADDFDSEYRYVKKQCPHNDIKETNDGFMLTYEGLYGEPLSEATLVTFIIYIHTIQNIKELDYE